MAAAQVVANSANPYLMLTSGASGRVNALFSRRFLRCLIAIINAFIVIFLVPLRCWKRTVVITLTEKSKEERQQDHHRKSGSGGSSSSASPGSVLRFPAIFLPWRSGTGGGVVGGLEQEVTARRALAIRRVIQDDDEGSAREFCSFVSSRGDTIFTQSWTPFSLDVRGIIVLMHGLNEHSGRYNDFARQLNAYGFKVYAMDWIGHGGSDGLHAYVHSLDDAVNDMKLYLEKVLADNPGLPCFCFGHSTGAAIVLKAVLDPKIEARVAGVVLTSPAVGVQPSHPIFVLLAPIVSLLLPRCQISAANKKGMPVSRDPEALVAKYSDPLVYTGAIRVRTGYEILRISTYLQQNQNRLRVPFLVLHGTADTVTDPGASEKLYMEASSTDKTIKLYEGFLHDLLFEPERDAIKEEIIEWLNSRL